MEQYTGYKRSLYVEVTKTVGGETVVGYPKSYPTSADTANGYFTYNSVQYPIPDNETELPYMSVTDYNNLVNVFELYVESIEGVSFITDEINTNVEYDPYLCAPPECNINYTILPNEFIDDTVTITYALTSGSGSVMVELIGSNGVVGTNVEHTIPVTNNFTGIPIDDTYQIVFTDLTAPECYKYDNLAWCVTCEDGYIPIEDECILYNTIDPTYYTTNYTVVRKAENSSYGLYGAAIFSDWNYDGTGVYERIPATNPYWINTPYPSLGGPMNRSCVWGSTTTSNQDIGFSFCIDIGVSKTYYVGFGCDNYGKVKINGTVVLEQDVDALATMFAANGDPIGGGGGIYTDRIPFRYWFIYPIFLPAGKNIVEVFGHNEYSVAAVGIHIYDATSYDLIAATSDEDLGDKKIFDSLDLVGTPLHYEYSASGGYHGYVCPTGYALDTCSGTYNCVKRDIVPCYTGETSYIGSWYDYVCIVDNTPPTGTTTTLEPLTEELVISNGGVASFVSQFWSKTLNRRVNHGQPFTYSGIITKIGVGITLSIGNPDHNFQAYIYEGVMTGDGSTNILLGISTNKIHASEISYNWDFWYFDFDNVNVNGEVSVVIRSTDVVLMNDNNYMGYRCSVVYNYSGTNISRTVPANWHYNVGLNSWLRVYALV